MPNKHDAELFEYLIKQAVEEYCEDETDKIHWEIESGETVASPKLRKRIRGIEKQIDRPAAIRFRLKVAVSIAVVLIATFAILTMTVTAFREAVFDFFFNTDMDTHVAYYYPEDSKTYFDVLKSLGDSWTRIYYPEHERITGLIPEVKIYDNTVSLYFENDKYYIEVVQRNLLGSMNLDNERNNREQIEIHHNRAVMSVYDDFIHIIWHENGYTLFISTSLSRSEAIEIAESIISLDRMGQVDRK